MESLKNKIYSLLRKSEKFTKTDMVYLTKGGFWLASGQLLNICLSFILSLTFANLVTQEVYGFYRYILAVATFIGSFSLTGLNSSIVASIARGFDGTFKRAIAISLKANFLAFAGALLTSGYYFIKGNTTLSFGILIAGLAIPLVRSLSLYGPYLSGKKMFKEKSLYGLIASGSSTISLIATILLITRENVVWLLASYFIMLISINTLFLKRVLKNTENDSVEPKAIRHGIHASIINLLGATANNIDSILIFQYIGAAELAIYSFAILVPENIKDIIKNIPALAIPKIATKTIEETKKNIYKKSAMIIMATVPIVIIYIMAAPSIYQLLFPAYTDSIPFSQAFALTILLAGGLSGAAIQAHHAIKASYALTGFSHLSRLVLILSLFPFYGIWGIVIGRVISKYLTSTVSYILIKRL